MTPEEYAARKRAEMQEQTANKAAFLVSQPLPKSPDETASAFALAKSLGLPPAVVDVNYKSFAQKMHEKRVGMILRNSPLAANWLTKDENFRIAADTVDELSWWERFGKEVKETGKSMPGGAVSIAGQATEGVGQLINPVDPAVTFEIRNRIASAQSKTPEEIAALRKDLFNQGQLNPAFAQSVLSDVLDGSMTPADALDVLAPLAGMQEASDALQAGGEAIQQYGSEILPADKGMEDSVGRQLGSGLGSMATIILVGLLTGGTGAATFGGAAGAGEASSRAREAGQDEEMQSLAAAFGILPGMTDAIPVERLLANPALKAGLSRFFLSIGKQSATEGFQEGFQQLLQNSIAQSLYAPDQGLTDGLIQSFTTGGAVGALVEAGRLAFNAVLPGRLQRGSQQAAAAPDQAQTFADMSAAAQQSVLRNRSPDAFRQFLEQATNGTPNDSIYVDANAFKTFAQSRGQDPFDLIDELDGVTRDDWAAAQESGDLKIPTATYAAKLAGSEYDQFIMENGRFSPDAMSMSEAARFEEMKADLTAEAWQEAEAVRNEAEEFRSMEEQIYDSVVSRLRVAGQSVEASTAPALLWQKFYSTMAAKSGMSIGEFMGRYALPEVRGSVPAGLQLRNVDELNRTLAEARTRKAVKDTRTPLLEWIADYGGINDVGGELKARNADVIKRGPGKKTLKLARKGMVTGMKDMLGGGSDGKKFGADDVARAAIDAGYLQNDPIANEYRTAMMEGREVPDITAALWDAIDRELRDEPDFAEAADAVDANAQFDEMEAYLSTLGVSLDDSDDAIRQALEKAKVYGQFAGVNAKTSPDTYDEAVVLLADGASGDEIFERTGWSVGADGKLRFEISDDKAALKPNVRDIEIVDVATKPGELPTLGTTLKDVVVHDRLFDAYPQLRNIKFRLRQGMADRTGGAAGVTEKGDTIWFDEDIWRNTYEKKFSDKAILSGVLHEVQHLIQSIEGFDNGLGGVSSPENYKRSAGEVEARNTQKRLSMSDTERANSNPTTTADLKPNEQIVVSSPFTLDNSEIQAARQRLKSKQDAKAADLRKQQEENVEQEAEKFVEKNYKEVGEFDYIYDEPHYFMRMAAADWLSGKRSGWHPDILKFLSEKIGEGSRSYNQSGDITQTPEFKAWFGDSKVVDADGKPLVVYHGTDKTFDTFNPAKAGKKGVSDAGIFFAEHPGTASNFAAYNWDEKKNRPSDILSRFGIKETAPQILPVYLSIKNPLIVEKLTDVPRGKDLQSIKDQGFDGIKINRPPSEDGSNVTWIAFSPEQIKSVNNRGTFDPNDPRILYQNEGGPRGLISFPAGGVASGDTVIRLMETANLSTFLHESGHFFLAVMQDMAARGGGPISAEYDVVKSWWRENAAAVAADANKAGGMSRGNYAQSADTSAFKKWFGASKVVDDQGKPLVVYHGTQSPKIPAFRRSEDGIFFTDEIDLANEFGPFTQETYLKLENPYIVDFEGQQTGKNVFDAVAFAKENGFDGVIAKNVSEGEGVPIHTQFVAFEPTQIKSVNNRGTFDPNDPRILFQPFDNGDQQNPVVVTSADVIRALDTGSSGDSIKDMLIDVGMQEQWARGFEAYLMEGKAPSVELQSVFEKFMYWLQRIYKSALGLGVKINDDIRGVFDRMLATEAEITRAKEMTGDGGMIFATAEQMGMTPEQFEKFKQLVQQGTDQAKAKVRAEAMEPIRRETEKQFKEQKAAMRADVERELKSTPIYRAIQEMRFGKTFEGDDTPIKLDRALIERDYGAGYVTFLPGASKDGKGHRNAVFANEGGVHPDIAAGMYGFETGRDLLDKMSNVPPLSDAIKAETDKRVFERYGDPLQDGSIEEIAMEAVHNDKKAQALEIELKALTDIAGDDGNMLTRKEAREAARQALKGMAVADAMRFDRFLAAERKAGEEAATQGRKVVRSGMWMQAARRKAQVAARASVREDDAANALRVPAQVDAANESTGRYNEQVADLIDAKRRQLLNHMMYAESRKVRETVEGIVDKVGKLNKPDARLGKTIGIDYVKAARTIAAKFGLARPDNDFEFMVWMQQLQFEDPVTADAMRDVISVYTQEVKEYKKLKVGEFEAVFDAIENILSTGRRVKVLEVGGQKYERQTAIAELNAVIDARGPIAPMGKRKVQFLTYLSALKRVEDWAREMDDGKQGVFTKYLVRPIFDALGEYRADRTVRLKELLDIINARKDSLLGPAINAPELRDKFENKGQLFHALLHTGNESNLEKLLLGRGWADGFTDQQQAVTAKGKPRFDRQGNPIMTRGRVNTARWDAFLSRMIAEGTITKEDYDMARAIWDLMESTKRPAQATYKKIHGHYFEEIEASIIQTPWGPVKGGYVPAIADRDASNDGQIRADQATVEGQQSSFMFPTTGAGFTNSRVQNYNTPLSLDLTLLPAHLDKVLRFTHLEPVIRQTGSLVTSGDFRRKLDEYDKTIAPNMLVPWLQRTAQQAVESGQGTPAARDASKFWGALRRRVGVHMMFLNLVNSAQQITGISTAMVAVRPTFMKSAMIRFIRDAGAMRKEIVSASPFMAERFGNASREIQGRIQDAVTNPTIMGSFKNFSERHGYFLQSAVQNVIEVPIWSAAYDQAISKGMSEKDAVFEADSLVRRSQSDNKPESISLFETGNAFMRLFTQFVGFFNGQANFIGTEMSIVMRNMGWAGSPRMFYIYLMGIAVPAIASQLIVDAARGDLGDDGEDGYFDDLTSLIFGSQARYLAAGVPIAGSVGQTVFNTFNDKQYDDHLSTSPTFAVVERSIQASSNIYKAASGDGDKSQAVGDGLTLLGLILGVPTGWLVKTSGYAIDVAEGDANPAGPVDLLQGAVSGRDGTQ